MFTYNPLLETKFANVLYIVFLAIKQHFIRMQLVNDPILYMKTIHIIYKIHNSMGTFFDWGPEQQ